MDSIAKSDLEAELIKLVERQLAPHGFHAVDVDCFLANRSLVRIFVERAEGESLAKVGEENNGVPKVGTTIDDCAKISRLIGPVIDVENLVPGAYDLEVSSPGLDRRLRLRSHFEKHIGSEVKLRLVEPLDQLGAKPRGYLVAVKEGKLIINVSGREFEVPMSTVRRANLVWEG